MRVETLSVAKSLGLAAVPRRRRAPCDPWWVRGGLTLAALAVIGVLVVLPVVSVFAQALAEGTIANHPPMSPYHLSASEIADIVRYLNSIQTDQQSQNAPAARWTVKALDP